MNVKMNKKEDCIEYWGDITKIVTELMGNFILSAHILVFEDYSKLFTAPSEIQQMADEIEKEYEQKGRLECDDALVVITFTNDKTIVFSNSEWGSIKKHKKLNFEEA